MIPNNQPHFKVEVEKRVDKRLSQLHPKHRQQVLKRMVELQLNPRPQDSIKLKDVHGYRLTMGDYRILYDIDYNTKTIKIWKLIDRKEGYNHLQ